MSRSFSGLTISDDSQDQVNKSYIDFPPETSDDFFRRGLKNAQLGILDKAVSDFEEAAWLDPKNHEIQFNLGTAYLSMGDFEQAISNFSKAIKLKPDVADIYGNRAVAHAAIGQDIESEKDFDEAVRLGAPPDGLGVVINYVKDKHRNPS